MMVYVVGGSGSGKSAFAERLIVESQWNTRTYLATMQVWDEEGQRRVERHCDLRRGKGFATLESPFVTSLPPLTGALLVEDLTNLFMNEWFSAPEDAKERVESFLHTLAQQVELLVIVGNDLDRDGTTFAPEMEDYLKGLGALGQAIAHKADCVYEVVCGTPRTISKGRGQDGMTLIIGGKYQGKLAVAKTMTGHDTVATCPELAQDSAIFYGLETWLKTQEEPQKVLDSVLNVNHNITIVCDEVGCGVVPLEKEERIWRERVGRVCVELAQRATCVVRVVCGIPTIIKESAD